MRIAVSPQVQPLLTQVMSTVLRQDDSTNRTPETTGLERLLNDAAFKVVAGRALRQAGASILGTIKPEAADLVFGNPSVALAADFADIVTLLSKGDRISLEQLGGATAEVVDMISDYLPYGRAIKSAAAIFEVLLPLYGVLSIVREEMRQPMTHETAIPQTHNMLSLPNATTRNHLTLEVMFKPVDFETAILQAHTRQRLSNTTSLNPLVPANFLSEGICAPYRKLSEFFKIYQ